MFKITKFLPIIICCILGCSHVQEKAKVFWGSSTKALEEARMDGQSHSFACSTETCFDQTLIAVTKAPYQIFINDPKKNIIVVMGIPGCINTTEVGIFLEPINSHETLIQVASLSSRAMRSVAAIVFDHLKSALPASEQND